MAIRHFRCDTKGVCHTPLFYYVASQRLRCTAIHFREDNIPHWSSEVLSMQFMNLNILFGDRYYLAEAVGYLFKVDLFVCLAIA